MYKYNSKKLDNVIKNIETVLAELGLPLPQATLVLVPTTKEFMYKRKLVEIAEGIYAKEGIIAIRENVSYDYFIYGLLVGYLYLAMEETIGIADKEKVIKYARKYFYRILSRT